MTCDFLHSTLYAPNIVLWFEWSFTAKCAKPWPSHLNSDVSIYDQFWKNSIYRETSWWSHVVVKVCSTIKYMISLHSSYIFFVAGWENKGQDLLELKEFK